MRGIGAPKQEIKIEEEVPSRVCSVQQRHRPTLLRALRSNAVHVSKRGGI
jgi:hypothetical protein